MKKKKLSLVFLAGQLFYNICMEQPLGRDITNKKSTITCQWHSNAEQLSFFENYLNGSLEVCGEEIYFENIYNRGQKYTRILEEVQGLLDLIEENLKNRPIKNRPILSKIIIWMSLPPMNIVKFTDDDVHDYQYLEYDFFSGRDIVIKKLKESIAEKNNRVIINCCNFLKMYPCTSLFEHLIIHINKLYNG